MRAFFMRKVLRTTSPWELAMVHMNILLSSYSEVPIL